MNDLDDQQSKIYDNSLDETDTVTHDWTQPHCSHELLEHAPISLN